MINKKGVGQQHAKYTHFHSGTLPTFVFCQVSGIWSHRGKVLAWSQVTDSHKTHDLKLNNQFFLIFYHS